MLEKPLDNLVAEDIHNQLCDMRQDLLEYKLFFVSRDRFELLLDEATAVLILSELHNVTLEFVQLYLPVLATEVFQQLTLLVLAILVLLHVTLLLVLLIAVLVLPGISSLVSIIPIVSSLAPLSELIPRTLR